MQSPHQERSCEATECAQHGCHCLNASARDIVRNILRRETQPEVWQCARNAIDIEILRLEAFHEFCPQHTSSAQLRDLGKVIHADAPEKAQARRKVIAQTGSDTGHQILESVSKGVCQL